MEPFAQPTSDVFTDTERKPGATPWGVLIGLLLILVIIVSGAYYSFTKRLAPAANVPESPQVMP